MTNQGTSAPQTKAKTKSKTPSKAVASKINPISDRELALQQISTQRVQTTQTSDAQLSGPLHLEDPRPQIISRHWQYLFQINLIDAAPNGQIRTDAGIRYDLSERKRLAIPELEFGVTKTLTDRKFFGNPLWWSTSVGAGYMARNEEITLPSGFHIADAGMAIIVSRISFTTGISLNSNWDGVLGVERGQYQINQVSSNDLAQFSRKLQYWGVSTGADYKLPSNAKVLARYVYRNELTETQALPDGNLEIGIKFLW